MTVDEMRVALARLMDRVDDLEAEVSALRSQLAHQRPARVEVER